MHNRLLIHRCWPWGETCGGWWRRTSLMFNAFACSFFPYDDGDACAAVLMALWPYIVMHDIAGCTYIADTLEFRICYTAVNAVITSWVAAAGFWLCHDIVIIHPAQNLLLLLFFAFHLFSLPSGPFISDPNGNRATFLFSPEDTRPYLHYIP